MYLPNISYELPCYKYIYSAYRSQLYLVTSLYGWYLFLIQLWPELTILERVYISYMLAIVSHRKGLREMSSFLVLRQMYFRLCLFSFELRFRIFLRYYNSDNVLFKYPVITLNMFVYSFTFIMNTTREITRTVSKLKSYTPNSIEVTRSHGYIWCPYFRVQLI